MSEKGDWKRFGRLAGAAGKGFVIGAGLKGGLAAFAMLARMRARSSRWDVNFVVLCSSCVEGKKIASFGVECANFEVLRFRGDGFFSIVVSVDRLRARIRELWWRL